MHRYYQEHQRQRRLTMLILTLIARKRREQIGLDIVVVYAVNDDN